jgi:hypothetical protein
MSIPNEEQTARAHIDRVLASAEGWLIATVRMAVDGNCDGGFALIEARNKVIDTIMEISQDLL